MSYFFWVIFYGAVYTQNIHHHLKTKKLKIQCYMDEQIAWKRGGDKTFIMILCKKILNFESKNKIVNINLNQSNNCCLYSLKSKDLSCIKLLQTTYYLHFSILLFPSLLKLKNPKTMFCINFYYIKVIITTK